MLRGICIKSTAFLAGATQTGGVRNMLIRSEGFRHLRFGVWESELARDQAGERSVA